MRYFAIFDDRLNWCPRGLKLHEWLVETGMFDEVQYKDLVKGHVDDSCIYIYVDNANILDYIEDIARSWVNSIDRTKSAQLGVVDRGSWVAVKHLR